MKKLYTIFLALMLMIMLTVNAGAYGINITQGVGNKADKSNVLGLDNTDAYTPTAYNHPATKGYVDSAQSSGPLLSISTKTDWENNEQIEITLTTESDGVGELHVSVYEKVDQTGVTNSKWDVEAADTGYSQEDSAYAQTITPSGTSGEITLTLGSGSWSSDDVGKTVTNLVAGETGIAVVKSIASGVATVETSTDFTDTDAIASGSWKMEAIVFEADEAKLSSVSSYAADSGTTGATGEANSYENWIAKLDDDQAIALWRTTAGDNPLMAAVVDISGTTFTYGTPLEVNVKGGSNVRIAVLSDTKVIISFRDSEETGTTRGCVLSVSGSTLSKGTEMEITTISASYCDIAALSDSSAIWVAGYSGSFFCIGLTVSGTTITAGSSAEIQAKQGYYPFVQAISATQALAIWNDPLDDNYVYGAVINQSGTTVTPQTPVLISSSYPASMGLTKHSATKYVAYHGIYASVLTTSGNTFTVGAANNVGVSAYYRYNGMVNIVDGYDFFTYRTGTESNAVVFSRLGDTVTAGTPSEYDSSAISKWQHPIVLSNGQGFVQYVIDDASDVQYYCPISVLSAYQVDSQHVPFVSSVKTVNTKYFTDLNSMTVTDVLDSQTINYAFCFEPTLTSNVVTGGTFIVIGDGETTVRNIASSLNSVHGGIEGTWYVNTNVTYSSETWTAATTNSLYGALSQAEATTSNNMDSTDVEAVADDNWPSFGDYLAVATILYSDDSSEMPYLDNITFDYDGDDLNRLNADFIVDNPGTDLVRITAPGSGGPRDAIIYISK